MTDNLRASAGKSTSAQAAGFGVDALQTRVAALRASDGRVSGDDAGDVARASQFENLIQRLKSKIWRDFDQNGLGSRGRLEFLNTGQNFIQRCFVLELAEIQRVGRTDIDDEEIRVTAEKTKGVGVIFRRFFQRRDFGFAEINPDGMFGPAPEGAPFGKRLSNGFRAGIVTSHAVN